MTSTTKISATRQYYHIQPHHSVLVSGPSIKGTFFAQFFGTSKDSKTGTFLGTREVSSHREAIDLLKEIVRKEAK